MKKTALLFLALLFPAVIFVFLKFFGKNEFDVPLLHADGVGQVPGNCAKYNYAKPYVVPDSIFSKFNFSGKLLMLNFGSSAAKLEKIVSKFADAGLQSIASADANMLTAETKDCVLLIQNPATIVLIDDRRQIRGYYDGSDRDEIDRLEAEVIILLKQY